jgi:hypothetical protein
MNCITPPACRDCSIDEHYSLIRKNIKGWTLSMRWAKIERVGMPIYQ